MTTESKDWGVEAQRVAEAHLELLDQWMDYYDNEHDPDAGVPRPDQPDPSSAPFDGCGTCVVRETLHAAWPVIEEAVRSGDFG